MNIKSIDVKNKILNRKINLFNIFKQSSTNNLIKYNKIVFTDNKYKEKILEENENKFKSNKHKRRSIYRGVSKNGTKWQVLIMNKNINYFLGNFKSEEFAAKIYDYFALKFRGNKAITNFGYSEHQIFIIQNKLRNIYL